MISRHVPSQKRRMADQHVSNFDVHRKPVRILLDDRVDSVGLGWSLRFGISNKLPGDADAVGP